MKNRTLRRTSIHITAGRTFRTLLKKKIFFTEDIKYYVVFPLWSQANTAALLQQKPPSTRASHDNCSVQDINSRNALYSDSNTSHSIFRVKI